jgi:pimeloyl-ACP methyl ester carboxylesterase
MPNSSSAIRLTGETHLIFLPGLHGTDELFDDLVGQLKLLEVSFQTTLINYPPDPKQSYQELFNWLCSHLVLDQEITDNKTKIVIIAESFSTPIALKLADKFPKQVKAIIIGGGFCTSPANPIISLLPLRPLFMIAPPRSAVEYFLTGSGSSPELMNKVRSTIKKVSSKNISQRVRSILTLDEEQTPTVSETPVLLFQAENDAVIPWEIQNQLENHLPHAECHWLDSPHLIFQAHPKTCALHIVEFLTK